jgi:hypothetical protein
MAGAHRDGGESIWEWRVFCPIGLMPVVTQSIFERLGGRESLITDRYMLVDGLRHNVKARKRNLQVKEFVEARGGFQRYRRKQRHAFPLNSGQVKTILPHLVNGAVRDYDDIADLVRGLRRQGHRAQCVEVAKCRRRFVDEDIVMEATTLTVGLRRFWSIGFEGNDLQRLKSYTPDMPDGDAIIGGYVDFLGEIDSDRLLGR